MNFGIVTNADKDIDFKYTNILMDKILKNGGKSEVITNMNKIKKFDILICLGGDGTFLKTARSNWDIPIIGINLGSLGFLTEIDKNNIDFAIENIMKKKYKIEHRCMLDVNIVRDSNVIFSDIAVNDVVISRGALSRILHVKTYINNNFMNSFPGDGLIISTPTGSTGYSLSAGGPIVEPDINLIIITPICPHTLCSRSFVTTDDRTIKVIIDENYCHDAMVTFDGQNGCEIRGADIIEINKSEKKLKILKFTTKNFFDVLRRKIYNKENC